MLCFQGKNSQNRDNVSRRRQIVYLSHLRMYWMLNIVTGVKNNPQAVLIRGVENCAGPGKLTKNLGIDKSYYGEDLVFSDRIWFEDSGFTYKIKNGPRIGIEYAGEYWKLRPWRYYI